MIENRDLIDKICFKMKFRVFNNAMRYFAADETEMTVTWLTLNATNLTAVEFGPKSGYGVRFTRRILGSMSLFTDGGSERRNLYIHRVTLKNLKPGFVYC